MECPNCGELVMDRENWLQMCSKDRPKFVPSLPGGPHPKFKGYDPKKARCPRCRMSLAEAYGLSEET